MKLKGFAIDEILWDNGNYNKITENEIKDRLQPYIIYFKKDDSIGVCFQEQKENIVKILKEYGNTDLKSQFINFDNFISSDDYDWDNIFVGEIELDSRIVWKEFGKLIKENESKLINSIDNFENEWYNLQKIALRKVLNKEINKRRKEIDKIINDAEDDYKNYIGINERKNDSL